MSPLATDAVAERPSRKATTPRHSLLGPAVEPRPQPSPVAIKTPAPASPATSVLTPETKAVAPTLPPAASPPPLKTQSDVMAMHGAYGNAAMARAATTGALSPAAHAAPAVANEETAHATKASSAAVPGVAATPAKEKHEPSKPHEESPAAHPAANPPLGAHAPIPRTGAAKAPEAAAKASAAPAAAKPGEAPKAAAHPAKPAAGAHGEARGEEGAKKHTAPSAKEAIAPLVTALHHRAATARKHSAPGVPVASAQAAAIRPSTEQTRTAAMQTVANLDAAKTGQIKRDDFKAKLKKAIKDATPQPKTEKQADELMKSGASNASSTVKGELSTQNQAASGQLQSATADVPASLQPEPPKADLKPEPVGEAPAPVATGSAVPPPLPPEQLDYSSDREPTDKAMADAGVTREQLEQGNEPEFKQNLAARSDAEKHEGAAQQGYRKNEAGLRGQVEHTAHTEVSQGLANIHAARSGKIGKVVEQQHTTKEKHAAEHQRITDKINEIKNNTRGEVEKTLTAMEKEAGDIFGKGLADAEKAYQDTFEEEKGGAWTWLTTWGSDWEELIEHSLGKARDKYLAKVDEAIDKVADCVDARLEEAKRKVADGRSQVETYVKGLDESVRGFGEKALKAVTTDFEQMTGEIDQRRDALVDKLTQQYKASYERMSAMEEKLREENKSLWQRIYDATVGLIKKILEFKDMLLNVLARAAEAIGTIIAHPIAFLGNLIDAGKLGFNNFVDHIGEHLKQGFMEWLFGAVAETGITIPKNFDLAGILNLVLQVLGLTYANIRARAVKILGEKVVKALETAAEIFKILITKGPAGLWEYIKEKIGDLKAMVIDKIKSFIMEKVIMAGITWVIGLLNPASAFFKACKAIYDIIMFFVEHGKQILDLVNAIIDSISSIAKGAIGAAAQFVETSLARTIPVIIGFLASLLGVGGISEKIKEIIEDIRKPINEAIDWVITKAVDLVKAVGGLLGFGKKEEQDVAKGEKPEGSIDVPAPMSGTEHELTVVPGPEPAVVLASPDAKAMSKKIAKAIEELEKAGGDKKGQVGALNALLKKQEELKTLLKNKKEEEAKNLAQSLASDIVSYATKYKVKDLEEIGGLYPTPEIGLYGELTPKEKEVELPDGKIREAHHAPQVQFAISLATELSSAGRTLSRTDAEAGDRLTQAADSLKSETDPDELPAILVHQDTHRTHGGGSRIHGSEIRPELDKALMQAEAEGEIKGSAVAKTAADDTAVKPGGATYTRTIRSYASEATGQRAISRALADKGPKIVQDVYDAERERSLGAVELAVEASKVDGPDDKKAGVLSKFRSFATRKWNGFINHAKAALKG